MNLAYKQFFINNMEDNYFANEFFSDDEECQEYNDTFKEEAKGKEGKDEIHYTNKLDYEEDFESQKEDIMDTDILKIHAEDYFDDDNEMRTNESFSTSNNVVNQNPNDPSASSHPIEEHQERTVAFKNLLFKLTVEDIRAMFEDCGEIESLFCKRDFRGRSRGFGYIVFKDKESAVKALEKNNTVLEDRPMAVTAYKPEVRRDHENKERERDKLFVSGIPVTMTKEEIRNFFEPHGEIKYFKMLKKQGGFKGACFIGYCDVDTAASVKEATDQFEIVPEQKITVKYAIPQKCTLKSLREVPSDVGSLEPSNANLAAADPSGNGSSAADPGSAQINQKSDKWCHLCGCHSDQCTSKHKHKQRKQQEIQEIQNKIRMQGDSSVVKFTDADRLKCTVCDVYLVPNVSVLDEHLGGKEHLLNVDSHSQETSLRCLPPKGVTVQLKPGISDTIYVVWRRFNPDGEYKHKVKGYKIKYWEANQDISQAIEIKISGGHTSKADIRGRFTPGTTYKLGVMAYSQFEDSKISDPPYEFQISKGTYCKYYVHGLCRKEAACPFLHIRGDETGDYWCEICKIKFKYDYTDICLHNSGSKHLKKAAAQEILRKLSQEYDCFKEDPVTGILRCLLCNIPVTSPTLLKTHFEGSKHKNMVNKTTDGTANKAAVVSLPCESSRSITTSFMERAQEDYTKRKVCIKYIPKDFPDWDLQRILLACGKYSQFKRIIDAGTCSVLYDEIESALRCERVLHNCSIMNSSIQVILPYKNSISQKETEIVNKHLDFVIRKLIYSIQNNHNNRDKKRPGSRSPVRRKKILASNRSPDRKFMRSRSRSTDRDYRKSRSKSPDRKHKRSRSREKSHKRSEYVENSHIRNRKLVSRSNSNEAKFDKRSNELEKSNEITNVLTNTDIAILKNIIVTSIMTPIFNECGGKQHLCDSSKMIYRFETQKRARVIYMLLNKFRTPLGRAKLVYSQKVDTSLPDDSQETMLVMGIINETLKKNKEISIEILKNLGTQKNKIDPYLFKTEKCTFEVCQNKMKCTFYHNQEQIRRNPLKIMYFPFRCSEYHLGSCISGSFCMQCHSDYELNFHPNIIHKRVCSDWYRKGACVLDFDSVNCCINAHPETPELLFNKAWHDLYIAELKHTYQYLVGAIQNLRFINTQQQRIYILIVTPSIYMIHWLIEAIQELVSALRFDVNLIASDTIITEKEKNSHVVLCTPDGAIKLLEMPGVSSSLTLAGLILDDVSLLLHRYKGELETIGKAVMHSTPCVVAVADKVYKQDVNKLSTLLCKQFNTIGTVSSSQQETDFPSSLTIDSTLSSSNTNSQNYSSTHTKTQNSEIYESSTVTETKKNYQYESSSVTESKKSNMYIENPHNSKEYSAVEACHLLRGLCDQIGILGISLKVALEKIDLENDPYKISESLTDSDSQELLNLISDKFKKLRDKTNDSILKSKYTQASFATKSLIDSTKLYLEFKSNLGLDKKHSRTVSRSSKIENENFTASTSSSLCLDSEFVMDNPPKFYSSKPFLHKEVNSFQGILGSSSSSLKSDFVLDNPQKNYSSKLTQEEKMLCQGILGTNKNSVLPSLQNDPQSSEERSWKDNFRDNKDDVSSNSVSFDPSSIIPGNDSSKLTQEEMMLFQDILGKNKNSVLPSLQNDPQRSEERSWKDSFRDNKDDVSSNSVSFDPNSKLEMMDEIGENFNFDSSTGMTQRTHSKNFWNEVRTQDINQIPYNASVSLSSGDFSQKFVDGMFKVAIFGHEYIEVLPFNSGETFNSKNPGNLYQTIKYFKHGAEIFKVHDYNIWKEVILAQPNVIFLVLGKNDITEYASPQNIANRMEKIKRDLEKSIPNVRIICFGLENREFDKHWSNCQYILNRCLGTCFETIVFPTVNVDIGDSNYGAVTKVWRYMQEIIEDIKLQHDVLCKSKEMQSKNVGMKDMLSRYIDMLK